jgi:hypothetical protein
MNYLNKYLKYKKKYLTLKNRRITLGGSNTFNNIFQYRSENQINIFQNQIKLEQTRFNINQNELYYYNLKYQIYQDSFTDLFGLNVINNDDYFNSLEYVYENNYGRQNIDEIKIYHPTFISTTFSFLEKFDLPKELKKSVIDDLANINGPKYYIIDWANLIFRNCNVDIILKMIEWLDNGNYIIISSKIIKLNKDINNILDILNYYDLPIINKLGYYIQNEKLIIIEYYSLEINPSSIDDAVFWLVVILFAFIIFNNRFF